MQTIHHPPPKIIPADDAILAATFRAAYRRRQLDLLEAVIADPARGVDIAVAAGVKDGHFEDDLLILWTCIDVGRSAGRVLGRLMRHELWAASYWDTRVGRENYGRAFWSDTTLASLFGAMFFSGMYVRFTAARLVEGLDRWIEAQTHYRYAIRVLEEAE